MTDELLEWNTRLSERVDEKVREVERLNMLRRFVTPQLAEAIAAGGDSILASHRREITVLFCDMRGFTPFSDTAEPEEVMAVLREFHHAVGPMIFEHGGTIAQFTGDGMLVFFNDPLPCPDAAARAAKLAIEMRDAVAKLVPLWTKRGYSLGFGIGMAQGYATLGRIGFEDRFDYTAIGAVVNLASRLCSEAVDGQILASGRLAAAVEDIAEIEDLGERALRGMARPVAVRNLTALKV